MKPEEMPAGWLELRAAKQREWFLGNDSAIAFITMIMQVVEAWDDMIDRDHVVPDAQVNEAFLLALYGIPSNRFFQQHSQLLLPIVLIAVNAWHDANQFASHPESKLRNWAFHLRNFGLELYVMCALIVGGYEHMRKVSPEIRGFFALETFSG